MPRGQPYHPRPLRSLSARLLLLTMAFIMLGEVLIYAPSISRFRRDYLLERVVSGELAAKALEAAPEMTVSRALEDELLVRAEVRGVVLHKPGQRVLALSKNMPSAVDVTIDVREESSLSWIFGAYDSLFEPHRRVLRVLAESPFDKQVLVEVLIDERPMQRDMWRYSERIMAVSIVLSLLVAGLLYFSLHRLMIRPMRRIAESIAEFRRAPEAPGHGSPLSTRGDEIGVAERELMVMQEEIRNALALKSRLAALGGAVAKINHDLRNTLATAALATDRLAMVEDPVVKQLAPRLVESIDRAVHICGQTLDYVSGRGARQHLTEFRLADLCAELEAQLLPLNPEDAPPRRWEMEFPRDFTLVADRDQLGRGLGNLARNAFEAGASRVRLTVGREAGKIAIDIADDGPGLPQRALDNLFKPFAGSSRRGGTGLGLVIAHDMARAHGGDLALLDTGPHGTTFRFTLPAIEEP